MEGKRMALERPLTPTSERASNTGGRRRRISTACANTTSSENDFTIDFLLLNDLFLTVSALFGTCCIRKYQYVTGSPNKTMARIEFQSGPGGERQLAWPGVLLSFLMLVWWLRQTIMLSEQERSI